MLNRRLFPQAVLYKITGNEILVMLFSSLLNGAKNSK